MKVGLINGSPRGVKSNTDKILKWITPDVETEKVYTVKVNQHEEGIERIQDCDVLIFVFPLYTDSMPGVMKAFFEALAMRIDVFSGKSAVFIIHSGFTEAVHSRAIEKYVRYYATKIMGMNLVGTVVMGGSEALQVAPDEYFSKKMKAFAVLRENILNDEDLNEPALITIAGIERFNRSMRVLMRMAKMGDIYWNRQLKKNEVFDKRFDTPYSE